MKLEKSRSTKQGWQNTTLGAIARQGGRGIVDGPFGSNLPASLYQSDGVPLIRGSNLSLGTTHFKDGGYVFVSEETAQNLARSLCEPDDIIFTKKGTLGQTGIVPHTSKYKKFLLSGNQMRLSLDQSVADPLFVYYYVSSAASSEKIIRDSDVTDVPKTNVAYLRKFPILLPPLPIQHRIADILGALDDKIECNRRINQTLEAMAQALYKHWFVDFVPFRGGKFVDSELGEIPQGWEVKPIGEVVETLGGGTPSTKEPEYWDNGAINWYVPSDLTGARTLFISESSKKINRKGLAESAARIFPAHSVMMTSRATIGEIAVNRTEACTNQGFIAMIPNERLSLFQIVFWLHQNMEKILGMAHGTTFKEITRGTFRTFPVLVAKDADVYIRQSKALFDQIESNIVESAILTRTRDYLLPKLLSGEVEVKERALQM